MEAAWGIRQILDSRMADLMRRMTLERGYNPRDFVVLANGGAGPSHLVLSAELGLDSFVVPAAATAQSAYGIATAIRLCCGASCLRARRPRRQTGG